jgi:hypothetical protein
MFKNILKFAGAAAAVMFISAPLRADIAIPVPHIEFHHVHVAPPHVRIETRTVAPGPDYVWVGGFWDWQGDQWTWVSGRWERPAERTVIWVNPRYDREDDGWRYEPGAVNQFASKVATRVGMAHHIRTKKDHGHVT